MLARARPRRPGPHAGLQVRHPQVAVELGAPRRLVVVDAAPPRCNLATDIIALVAGKAYAALKAPPLAVTPPHTPVPFARELEAAYLPSPEKIEAAVRKTLAWK